MNHIHRRRAAALGVTLLLALAAGVARAGAASPVERVDPPSWWVGFKSPEL